ESPTPALQGVDFDQFTCLLEEVALVAWHGGNARTINANKLKRQLSESQQKMLKGLDDNLDKGVFRLLLGFFVGPQGRDEKADRSHCSTRNTDGAKGRTTWIFSRDGSAISKCRSSTSDCPHSLCTSNWKQKPKTMG